MLSIILPTYNEAENLPELFRSIRQVLGAEEYEIIVVDDDSPDRTWEAAEALKNRFPMVRVIRRIGRRGLSSAVLEGFADAKGEVLLVMDSDLQHDPATIKALSQAMQDGADLAVASRYTEGGSVGAWITSRRLLSLTATFLARKLPRVETSDPMSGFFAIRRSAYVPIAAYLKPQGFKILLELLAFLPKETRVKEAPLVFRERLHGESKLSLKIELQFLWQVLRIVLLRFQRLFFYGAVLCMLFLLLYQLWNVHLLYLSADVRAKVQASMRTVAEEEGWLLSDMLLQSVMPDRIRFLHRAHHRGMDETVCFVLLLDRNRLLPCPPEP